MTLQLAPLTESFDYDFKSFSSGLFPVGSSLSYAPLYVSKGVYTAILDGHLALFRVSYFHGRHLVCKGLFPLDNRGYVIQALLKAGIACKVPCPHAQADKDTIDFVYSTGAYALLEGKSNKHFRAAFNALYDRVCVYGVKQGDLQSVVSRIAVSPQANREAILRYTRRLLKVPPAHYEGIIGRDALDGSPVFISLWHTIEGTADCFYGWNRRKYSNGLARFQHIMECRAMNQWGIRYNNIGTAYNDSGLYHTKLHNHPIGFIGYRKLTPSSYLDSNTVLALTKGESIVI